MSKISLEQASPKLSDRQQELLEKFDRDSKIKSFDKPLLRDVAYFAAIGIALYHFITSFIGYPATHLHRSLHVAMMLGMTFVLYPSHKKASRKKMVWYDVLFVLGSLAVAAYVWGDYINFINRMGSPSRMDVIMGT
ncbi:MAG: C4-dicarboxylate ABC transporter permease, partial [Sphaerochaeta sp.]